MNLFLDKRMPLSLPWYVPVKSFLYYFVLIYEFPEVVHAVWCEIPKRFVHCFHRFNVGIDWRKRKEGKKKEGFLCLCTGFVSQAGKKKDIARNTVPCISGRNTTHDLLWFTIKPIGECTTTTYYNSALAIVVLENNFLIIIWLDQYLSN